MSAIIIVRVSRFAGCGSEKVRSYWRCPVAWGATSSCGSVTTLIHGPAIVDIALKESNRLDLIRDLHIRYLPHSS